MENKNDNLRQVVGPSFEEMSIKEMTNVQGAGTMSPQSSPASPVAISGSVSFSAGLVMSFVKC